MKIAYFTESLPPLIDGVTRTLTRLAGTLESEGIDFRFYSPVKPDDSISWNHRVRKVNSVQFPLYSYYRIGMPYFQGLEVELDAFQPDLIHAVSPTPLGYYGMSYGRKRKLGVVSSYHTHFVSYLNYYGFQRSEKLGWNYLQWFHNQGLRTFVPSPSAAQELRERGFHNVALWQRGIDVERFSPDFHDMVLRRSVAWDDEPILLFVGRLVKEKDIDDVIEASHILREMGNRFKIVFIGDGPMKSEIQDRLPDAHLPGFLAGRELAAWYATADLFVFPSTTETFGNVILEAFASGIPAIGVTKGGVADLITPGLNGLLAPPNAPGELAAKVQVLLNDAGYRMLLGRQARKHAMNFNWRDINLKLIKNYEQILRDQRN